MFKFKIKCFLFLFLVMFKGLIKNGWKGIFIIYLDKNNCWIVLDIKELFCNVDLLLFMYIEGGLVVNGIL